VIHSAENQITGNKEQQAKEKKRNEEKLELRVQPCNLVEGEAKLEKKITIWDSHHYHPAEAKKSSQYRTFPPSKKAPSFLAQDRRAVHLSEVDNSP
jgi:hypothetical protein